MKTATRKFSRKPSEGALLSGLAQSLILKERIKTTRVKGKEAARLAERMITRAKKGDLGSRRELRRQLGATAVKKLMDDLSARYQSRAGGYTRIIKLGQRSTDGAEIVFVELVK